MSEKRQFNFIRRNQSVRKDKKRDEEGTLARWLRELRGSGEPKTPAGLDRSNPAYHSEGKGQRKKNAKEKRRHSFNQKPQTLNPRCCGEREDGGRKERRLAMTGGTAKSSSQYIINTSPPDRCRSVIKGHEKGLSWGGEEPPSVRPQRNNSFSKQLKTVMERCEKMPPGDKFLPKVDRDGKTLGDSDYSIPSPPERDLSHLDHYGKYNETRLSQLSIDGGYDGSQTSLTRAELEQYSRTYEDVRPPSHSQQPSYAQSEGYHSYVSSADSTSTPFLDRLRREHVENNVGGRESSASSGSSSETLKWHGSLSDVSASHTQHIAHSARVPMPQRHHSESVLYLDPWPQHTNLNSQMRRLFPVTTYEPTSPRHLIEAYSSSRSPPKLSVAERISEIERQSQRVDDKRKMTDHASLKAIQKKALLSFYERHHSAWKSEPQLTTPSIPPQPPPRPQPLPSSRRSSSASDYAGAMKREIPRSHHDLSKLESNGMPSKHQHSSSCGSLSTAVLGPMIIGPSISVDDWVPARPPKKPHLRVAYQPRALSPDLPPPSPPPVTESEVFYSDEPLPPPPVEVLKDKKYDRAMNASMSLDNLTRSDTKHYENGESKHKTYQDKFNEKYVENRIEYNEIWDKKNYIDMRKYDEIMSPPLPNKGKRHHDQPRSLDSNLSIIENNQFNKPGPQTPKKISYKNIREHFIRSYESRPERQSLRITTSSQKLLVNGKIANAVHNGKISPPSRKANLVRTPSDVVRRVSYSIGIHHAEPLSKQHSEILNKETFAKTSPINSEKPSELFAKSPPSLPPHCPPTTLQLSQSKASSYLAYRRETKEKEKGLPDFQGSYKRTMSPSGGRIIENSAEKVTINEIEIKKEITKKEDECEKKEEPASQEPVANCDKETAKTLPRNYSLAVANKRSSRPPRAQSDPTSAKVEKKSVSASTQDNLDESREEKPTAVIARSQSDRTGESRVIDAASQTTPSPSPPPSLPRRQLQEEIECEQLSRDLASQLSPSHKLHGILVPGPEVKRTTDYVSGLFRMDFTPRSRSSLATQSITTQTIGKGDDITTDYLTAECKARLLSLNTENTQNSSMSSLQQKKEELMMRLSRKLSVLKEESIAVSEETSVNEALGEMVSERIEKVARPQEIAKFRLHVKEVGHITSLLLSLSGRLARAENALLITNLHDRKTLEEKRDKLLCQLNEAKQLKSNIDQRSISVSTMLYNYLTGDEYTDYDHFINMKSKLLVDAREIADKIQLGEEQLAALKETLDQVR